MICLIIPPSPFLLDERVFMSLGLLKVAASLERAGQKVEVLDLSGVKNYDDAVTAHLAQSSADCFGITATSPQLPAAVRIASLIKAAETVMPRRRYRTILGGPHATLVSAAAKRVAGGRAARALEKLKACFDVIVAGDGERAIFDAVHVPDGSLLDADDRHSPYWQTDADFNDGPWPARHLVDVGSYHYRIEGQRALSLIAQLGCPFGCGFCAGRHSPMLRNIRKRSAVSVVNEMKHLRDRYGVRGFMFYDDELNVNPDLVPLMDLITAEQFRRGEEWDLRGFVKAELFTTAQAIAMRRAGFRWILVGFESGSKRILTNINKKATRDDNTRCLEIAAANGLKVKALMSIGHPGESLHTIGETRRWLLETKPDDFDLTIITPYPGSPYYDEAVEIVCRVPPPPGPWHEQPAPTLGKVWAYTSPNGDRLYQDEVDYTLEADYYKGMPDGGYVARVWTNTMRPAELVTWRDVLEADLRARLGIPYNAGAPAIAYEHSMGQSALPPHILKRSGEPANV